MMVILMIGIVCIFILLFIYNFKCVLGNKVCVCFYSVLILVCGYCVVWLFKLVNGILVCVNNLLIGKFCYLNDLVIVLSY